MKKLIPILVCALLIASLCTVFVSAETSQTLILKDAAWVFNEGGGQNCTADFSTEGKVIVSAAGGWPHIRCEFTAEQCITASVSDSSLKYDFTVEHGNTNVSFLFYKEGAGYFEFPISNSALNLKSEQIESGSGDIVTGHYSGILKLTDLVAATKNYIGEGEDGKFNQSYVVDGKLTFAGVIVYSASGATVKVDELAVVTAGASEESSTGTASSETSKTETSKTEATSSTGTTSAGGTSSAPAASNGTTPPTGDSNTGMIIAIVLGALAVVAAGTVITVKVRH